ncbi:glycoside hydrolase family 127 protein [Jiangella ureilytica]|uniref:Glycoside hydrolase family 127 protein n=1 Tax=Jiangella ureilytica TaxID=2530374 RepID=A0A4R4RFL0_9ACTN|nr:beta-L-arabinofuranosidase domain-containing protein [Jiangella ureilytica]TDC48034.1 glycoside hydrolase family 127 protein [Jiangella ureilytica]
MTAATATTAPGGPVGAHASPHARWRPVAHDAVRLSPGGLLGRWQRRNTEATVPHCIEQLETAGNLDNLRRLVGESDAAYRGLHFADSDIYKVLEATGWDAGRPGGRYPREFVDDVAGLLARAQDADGYLNSWFQGVKTEDRFSDLRWGHELYCLGHLVQAAVALHRTTGRDDLLAIADRFLTLVSSVVESGETAGICGHPEIETALVELYRHTGERRHLELAARMIDARGHGRLGHDHFSSSYFQDHQPVRAADEVTGHAVRQLYLLTGVADVYLETGEPELLHAMERQWASMVDGKTHVTGGLGSRHRDESFGDRYELPAERAYAETCAAIASVMWNWRLLLATGHGRYADELERALYNAVAVGVSADGAGFTYSNPLQLRTGHDGSEEDSPSGRLPWFGCACCPPNLARLMASVHDYVVTTSDTELQLHLYAAGEYLLDGGVLHVSTDYPWDGVVTIAPDEGLRTRGLRLRVPGWCSSFSLVVDGAPVLEPLVEDGYVAVGPGPREVTLTLDLPVRTLRPHPRVDALRGCVAYTRGPVVYCLEQADLPGDLVLEDVRVTPGAAAPVAVAGDDVLPVVLAGRGRHRPPPPGPLYSAASSVADSGDDVAEIEFRLVPYFAWGNRGAGAMRVWIPADEDTNDRRNR